MSNEHPLGPCAFSWGKPGDAWASVYCTPSGTSINLGRNVITTEKHVQRLINKQKAHFIISVNESVITSSNNKPHLWAGFRFPSWHLIKHEKGKGTIVVFVCCVREQRLEDYYMRNWALKFWCLGSKAQALSLTSPLPGRDCKFLLSLASTMALVLAWESLLWGHMPGARHQAQSLLSIQVLLASSGYFPHWCFTVSPSLTHKLFFDYRQFQS